MLNVKQQRYNIRSSCSPSKRRETVDLASAAYAADSSGAANRTECIGSVLVRKAPYNTRSCHFSADCHKKLVNTAATQNVHGKRICSRPESVLSGQMYVPRAAQLSSRSRTAPFILGGLRNSCKCLRNVDSNRKILSRQPTKGLQAVLHQRKHRQRSQRAKAD
jgi:hypothetical protein